MRSVFLLHHVPKDDPYKERAKFIGAYESADDASAAIDRLKGQRGFADFVAGFEFEEVEIGKDHWTEGFGIVWDEDAQD